MHFAMLGHLEVRNAVGPVPIASVKRKVLLIALLAHPNQTVATERLAEWLWPEDPPPTAVLVMQGHISHLRRMLEPGRPPWTVPQMLITQQSGYRLAVQVQQLDTLLFEELATAGSRALRAGDVRRAERSLHRALSLWRGEALADVHAVPAAQGEITRLAEMRLSAITQVVDIELQMRRYNEIIADLTALTSAYPYHERFYAQLMLALTGSGRRAEALAVYRRAQRVLSSELGISPGRELRELEAGILSEDD